MSCCTGMISAMARRKSWKVDWPASKRSSFQMDGDTWRGMLLLHPFFFFFTRKEYLTSLLCILELREENFVGISI